MFNGDPFPWSMPANFEIATWLSRHSTDAIDPIIDSCLHTLRSQFSCKRIGAVGYCIGVSIAYRNNLPFYGFLTRFVTNEIFPRPNTLLVF
jgi:dienelactone hydrolase